MPRRPFTTNLPLVALGLVLLAFVALGGSAGAAPADTEPPSVPQGQALVDRTRTSVGMIWRASTDNVRVAGYRLYKNGRGVATVAKPGFTYRNLRCGTRYTFALAAYDAAGNASNRAFATGSISTLACAAPRPTTRPVPPPPRPAPASGATPTTANLWVDPNGGTCIRRNKRARWVDLQACSWSGAYGAARTGDLVLVRGGEYGDVTLGPNRASITAPGVTFRTAAGERAYLDEFENGAWTTTRGGANNLTLIGPVTARSFKADGVSNLVVDRWRVDCGGCVGIQTFHLNSENVTVRNSEISNNADAPLVWVGGSKVTFENNRIHDATLRPGSGAHTECMYVWQVTDLTLKRNHFYRCAIMDVFITGNAVANGGYIENNIFEKSFHFRNGGDPSPDPSNWDFRYNTFVGPLSFSRSENPVGAGGVRLVGNAFLSDAPSCGHANSTWSYNAFTSDPCGANAILRPLSTFLAGFNGTGSPGNYSLRSTSVLRDKGNPANFPPRDRAGRSRFAGRAPDIGAYEFR
jgi:chitodextrinase